MVRIETWNHGQEERGVIRNIVFDMGKVLVGYDAMRVCEHYIKDVEDRQQVCTAVFVSPEWVLLDMGVISEEQALQQICSRLPKRLHPAAHLCMENWHRYCMWTIPEMESVVRELKKKGFGIYLCSNASLRLLECWNEVIPASDCFDGMLFSSQVRCMKPQKEMYEHLFKRFSLNPEECFFVDDLALNIKGAAACGMEGWDFGDGDIERLKRKLETLEAPGVRGEEACLKQ